MHMLFICLAIQITNRDDDGGGGVWWWHIGVARLGTN